MPIAESLGEQFGHAGFLAEPLQAAGGAYDKKHARDIGDYAGRPGRVSETLESLSPTADYHDAEADQKKDQRPADAKDQFTRGTTAERLARHIADRLLHQQKQRDGDGEDKYHRRPQVLRRSARADLIDRALWRGRRPSHRDRAQRRQQHGKRQAEQRDAAPIGAEDGDGRDRYRREQHKAVARRNRKRQHGRRARTLPRRRAADDRKERRQQRECHRGRGTDTADQAEKRGAFVAGEPWAALNNRCEPVRSGAALGERGDKTCGDDHQSGRINHLGESGAERLAEKTDGKSANQPESRGDNHNRQKGVKASRGNKEYDDKGKKDERLD